MLGDALKGEGGHALKLVGRERPQVEVLKGFHLIRNEVERAIQQTFGLEEERVVNLFEGATWELHPDGTFIFSPAAVADGTLIPLSGVYLAADGVWSVQAQATTASGTTSSLDGHLRPDGASLLLEAIYTVCSLAPPLIARVRQRFTQPPPGGPDLGPRGAAAVSASGEAGAQAAGGVDAAAHAPSVFKVELSGSTEARPFGPLQARLSIFPSGRGDSERREVMLTTDSETVNGWIYWGSPATHTEDGRYRLTHTTSGELSPTTWFTLVSSAPDADSLAGVLVETGIFTFSIDGDSLTGEIQASGTYGLGLGETRPSFYTARLTGERVRSQFIEELRAAAARDVFGGQFVAVDSDFGRLELRELGASVSSTYTGRGGGSLEGVVRQTRVDFRWKDAEGGEGWGFLRAVGGGRALAGLWGRGADRSSCSTVVLERRFSRMAPDGVPAGEASRLKGLGTELLAEGRYEQAVEMFEKALSLYREELRARDSTDLWYENLLLDESSALTYLNMCYLYAGDYERILGCLEHSLEVLSVLVPSESFKRVLDVRVVSLTRSLAWASQSLAVIRTEFEKVRSSSAQAGRDDLSSSLASTLCGLARQLTRISDELAARAESVGRGRGDAVSALASLPTFVREQSAGLLDVFEGVVTSGPPLFAEHAEWRHQTCAFVSRLRREGRAALPHINWQELTGLEGRMADVLRGDVRLSSLERGRFITELTLGSVILPLCFELACEGDFVERLEVQSASERRTKESWEAALGLTYSLEQWRARLVADLEKVTALEKGQPFFRRLVKFLAEMGSTGEALLASERARARALGDLLASAEAGRGAGAFAFLEGHGYHNPFAAAPVTLEDVSRAARQRHSTIVEYFIAGDELFIWVVDPAGEITLRRGGRPRNGKALEELVSHARAGIGARGRNLAAPEAAGGDRTYLEELYHVLIAPITDLLPADAEAPVILIPHGPLFLVPFAALLSPGPPARHLVERHTILYAPSIQVLHSIGARAGAASSPGSGALVVGNPQMPAVRIEADGPPELLQPLPYAEEEAREVARLLKTDALTGESATKATVMRMMPGRRFIHLATHGLLDDIEGLGMPGAIALAPDAGRDGLLTAREIMDLRLDAELIVVSACNTGGGSVTGEGVVGLSRSFLYAGALNLVASLWAVSDESTRRLMVEFYRSLSQTRDHARALRLAMLSTMRREAFREPAHWAAFVLIGGGRTPPGGPAC